MTSTALQYPQPTATGTAPLAASALQKLLPDLVALSLNAKQAHWNVTGPACRHGPHRCRRAQMGGPRRRTDRGPRLYRRRASGHRRRHHGPFLAGRLGEREAIDELSILLHDVAATAGSALNMLAHADAVGHDIVVSVLEGLEKYRWMLHAQTT
jgi:starvation-inducible DNA-binding protein